MRKNRHLPAAFWLLASLPFPLLAGQDTADTEQHGRRSLTLTQAESPPVLDGQLDDPAWQDSAVIGNFIQKDPDAGMAASEMNRSLAIKFTHSFDF